MEAQMKINGAVVRALREQKSWSQEHLANASGLSVRTVQRVEVESIASPETRLALAAALGVPVTDFICADPQSTNATSFRRRLPFWGWLAWGVGAIGSLAVAVYGYRQGVFPPDQVLPNILPWIALLGICAGVLVMRAKWRRRDS